MALRALLFRDTNAPKSPWGRAPTVSFRVYESTEPLAGARLTIYECDYGEGVPADGATPTAKEALARFSIDATPGGKDGLQLAVTPLEAFVDGKLGPITAKALNERGYEASFAIYFGKGKGGKDVFLPAALGYVGVDEGTALELGMELEVGGQVVAAQLTAKETSASALEISDPLKHMLTLATPALGAAATDPRVETGAMAEARKKREAETANDEEPSAAKKAQKGKGAPKRGVPTLGRFNDAWRKPSVEPADAPTKLDPAILDLVKQYNDAHGAKAEGERPPPDIDVDGLRFTNFVAAADRKTVITDVLAPRIKHAWNVQKPKAAKKGEPPPPPPPSREGEAPRPDEPSAKNTPKYANKDNYGGFATGDIERAYFIVHDIGSGLGPFGSFRYTNERAHENDGKKAISVHGFLNQRGHYATYRDFGKVGMSVVYQYTAGINWLGERCIGIETVPYGSRTSAADTEVEQSTREAKPATVKIVSMGWVDGDKAGIYKWSDELMGALADLYVLASARAGHLLTVTAHAEVDRALVYSVLYGTPAETAARLTANGNWVPYARKPSSMHGDPYGFDMQVFYDAITVKLNALAKDRTKLTLPKGVRYGVHPARILVPMDGKKIHDGPRKSFPGLRLTKGNGSDEVHTFPHQSNPTVFTHHTSHATWNEYTTWSKGKWFWEQGWVEPTAADLEAMRADKEAKAKARKKAAEEKAAADKKKAAEKK